MSGVSWTEIVLNTKYVEDATATSTPEAIFMDIANVIEDLKIDCMDG